MFAWNRTITDAAHAQGFALVGFAAVRRLCEREEFYHRWLGEGRQGTMDYLARDPERRFDPRRIDPHFKTVVSLGYPCHAPAPPVIDWKSELRGRIAAYALGPDYHDVVVRAARAIADAITALGAEAITKVYVDTGPVFEREWAAEARLGWLGKNTMLLNRTHGSYFFLAEVFTDLELEPTREPYRPHCGTCARCLDRCPTGALAQGYLMAAGLCISYLTIENRGAIPRELRPRLGNWIFGCDLCQEACPWNVPFSEQVASALLPRLGELMTLDDRAFRERFGKTAVKRAKRRGLLRNSAVALGNSGNAEAVPILARVLETECEPLVRSHAAWALGQLGGAQAKRELERARMRETDAGAAAEIQLARVSLE